MPCAPASSARPIRPGIVLRHPHDRRQAAGACGDEAAEQSLVAAESVLLVDGHAVPARLPDQLDEEGVVQREPGVEQRAALFRRLAEPVFTHEAVLPFGFGFDLAIATPISSAICRLIWWSDWLTPLASKSDLILPNRSSSPGCDEVGLDDFAGIGLGRLARDPHLLCRPEPEQPVPPCRGFEFKLLVMGEFPLETLLAILETRHLACRLLGPLSIRGCWPRKSWGNSVPLAPRDSAEMAGNQQIAGATRLRPTNHCTPTPHRLRSLKTP